MADGRNGLKVLDVAVPADPRLERTVKAVAGEPPIDQAEAVIAASLPVRSFAIVADGSHGLRAVNISPTKDFRTQLAKADADRESFRGFRLSNERNDPMTPFDPKNLNEVITYPTGAPVRFIAKGLSLDTLTDVSGARWRDNWMIGSTSLSSEMQRRMRAVEVVELNGSPDMRGDGLGCVVRKGDEGRVQLTDDGRCLPALGPPRE